MPDYATQKNVQILLVLLKKFGVRKAVISPGSRNMALVMSLQNDPYFTCFSVVDERSAVYFAIGLSQDGDQPVLLSCTSAQATRNYIPGMTEAYYRGTPLVVVTADYRLSKIGQGTMQAIEQMSIPVDSAKISVRLPIVETDDDAAYCGRLVNEALLGMRHGGSGPVHVNLPIDEHWTGSVPVLPDVRKLEKYGISDAFPEIVGKKVLVAVGQHHPFDADQQRALDKFSIRYDATVYTNHLSNYHGPRSVNASLMVENMDFRTFEGYKPDILITIGGQLGDYGLDERLKYAEFEHWRIHPDGKIQDTYGSLKRVFQCEPNEFFEKYLEDEASPVDLGYFDRWRTGNARRSIPAELPLSHAYIAATLSPQIPTGSIMHFAILSSLRNWNFFELDPSVSGYSNVAAFGIDGCVSTFLGHAASSDSLAYLIVGDLSFFYDMNSIGLRHISENCRIVLINNGGGGEFRLYSHAADGFGEAADEHIAAAGHHGTAQAWVESLGWRYRGVHTKSEFSDAATELTFESDRPMLVEVFTTMYDDSEGVRLIREANTVESLERRIAKHLPPAVKRSAKKMLRR